MPKVQVSKGLGVRFGDLNIGDWFFLNWCKDSITCLKTGSTTCLDIENKESFELSDERHVCLIADKNIDITIHV